MKSLSPTPGQRPALMAAIFCLFLSFGLTGCVSLDIFSRKTISVDQQGQGQATQQTAPRGPVTAADITLDSAEKALAAKDMARAEIIATRLSARPGLAGDELARVSRVLAVSAAASRHPYVALSALERWKKAAPAADESFEWQNTYASLLRQLPPRDAVARAKAVTAEESRPYTLRYAAQLFIASQAWDAEKAAVATAPLTEMYNLTQDATQRAYMERSLFSALHAATPDAMQNLTSLVSDTNAKSYPYAVIQLENIRRLALSPETRSEAEDAAKALAKGSSLVDSSLFQAWKDASVTSASIVPVQGRTVVLALPLSGPLKAVGNRVVLGAREAVKEFAEAGYTVNLETIDTESPDWMDKIAALPPEAAIVGGPMHTNLFAEAHKRELTKHRLFMSFTPSLGGVATEGADAWRFFTSLEDQVNALLSFGENLGFTSYSILLPDGDAFASRMADLFASHARARGAQIAARGSYPADTMTKWHRIIASLMRSGKAASPRSQAIFLPDIWRNMETMADFLNYEDNRQVLMGTALWAQGLSAGATVPEQFERAVFPGSWQKAGVSPAAARLSARFVEAGHGTPDSWAGFGYDFMRFASALQLPQGVNATAINAVLSRQSAMDWSMAPITWSRSGKATQHLFLLSPTDMGASALTPEAVQTLFGKAKP